MFFSIRNGQKMKSAIIGGGFFGLYLADYLAKKGHSVTLFEKSNESMSRASYVNQARVHNGYHYPRSILTALRSRESFPNFVKEFESAIVSDFDKYYMIGKVLGKVTANQFQKFCKKIDAYCSPANGEITSLVNKQLIEEVFLTKEYAFDSTLLKAEMLRRLESQDVKQNYNTLVLSAESVGNKVKLNARNETTEFSEEFDQVFNCTYSMINSILHNSKLELIPLKHELTEMCIVEPPALLKNAGITVMCGPFFSIMPFPSKQAHSFSHVRYTPHSEWYDDANSYQTSHDIFDDVDKKSAWRKMIYDAQRYIPALAECSYKESIWEVKTVLPASEANDSRPILFKKDYGIKGLHCVMGGKIDNVYDAVTMIENMRLV